MAPAIAYTSVPLIRCIRAISEKFMVNASFSALAQRFGPPHTVSGGPNIEDDLYLVESKRERDIGVDLHDRLRVRIVG